MYKVPQLLLPFIFQTKMPLFSFFLILQFYLISLLFRYILDLQLWLHHRPSPPSSFIVDHHCHHNLHLWSSPSPSSQPPSPTTTIVIASSVANFYHHCPLHSPSLSKFRHLNNRACELRLTPLSMAIRSRLQTPILKTNSQQDAIVTTTDGTRSSDDRGELIGSGRQARSSPWIVQIP